MKHSEKTSNFNNFFLQHFQVTVFSVWLIGKISEIRKHIIASLKIKTSGHFNAFIPLEGHP